MESARPATKGTLAVALLALLVHGGLQLWSPGLPDRDAWFHARYADLLGGGEASWLGTSFPWLTRSAYADLPLDWSLLWHWLLVPFVRVFGTIPGLKVLTALQGVLLTLAFHDVLRRAGTKAAAAWTSLFVVGCAAALFRVEFGRPTPLALACLLVVLDLALRGRDVAAGAAALVTLLVYHVPAPLLLVVGAALAGRAVAERRLPLRTAGALAAGTVLGVLVHPGFWTTGDGGPLDRATFHLWRLMAGSLEAAAAGGRVTYADGGVLVLPLPKELLAPTLSGLVVQLWLPLAATAAAAVLVWWRRRDATAVAATLLACAGLAATCTSGRLSEYWYAFAMLGAAATVSARASGGGARPHAQLVGLSAVVLGALTLRSVVPMFERWGTDRGADVAPAIEAVAARAAPGDVVWHASWDDFAPLFHFAPQLRYDSGMDAWWVYAHDPEAARLHAQAVTGDLSPDELHATLTEVFRARHVVLWNRPDDSGRIHPLYAELEAELRAAPWAELVHEDAAAVAFTLR